MNCLLLFKLLKTMPMVDAVCGNHRITNSWVQIIHQPSHYPLNLKNKPSRNHTKSLKPKPIICIKFYQIITDAMRLNCNLDIWHIKFSVIIPLVCGFIGNLAINFAIGREHESTILYNLNILMLHKFYIICVTNVHDDTVSIFLTFIYFR